MKRIDQIDYYGCITYAGRTVAFSIRVTGDNMGNNTKIGITGLTPSGNSADLEKFLNMQI